MHEQQLPHHDHDKESLLDHLAEELTDRFKRGERPRLQVYVELYPQLASDLRQIFDALILLHRI
jgi:hypothetical protein